MNRKRRHYLETSTIVYLAADQYTPEDIKSRMHEQTLEAIRVARQSYVEVVTSTLSDRELADSKLKGMRRKSLRALQIVRSLPHVPITSEARRIVAKAIGRHSRHYVDFLHYAVAAVNNVEAVLTWNMGDFKLAEHVLTPLLAKAGWDHPKVMTPEQSTDFLLRTALPPRDNPRRRGNVRRRVRR